MVTEFIFKVKSGQRKFSLCFSLETDLERIADGKDLVIDDQSVRIVGKNPEINETASHKNCWKVFVLTREESGVTVEFRKGIEFICATLHQRYNNAWVEILCK